MRHPAFAPIALLLITAAATAAAVGQGEARAMTATRCVKPLKLSFTRKIGTTAGTLRWRAPRTLPASFAGYRVFRDGIVVGQVRSKRVRVRFTPGRKTTFGVKLALRNGRTLPCRAALVKRLRWRLPTPPSQVVLEARDDGVLVSWAPSKRGDGRLVGYRVFKDGTAIGQVHERSVLAAVPVLRTVTIQIRAVDNRGKVSRPSEAATIVRGHSPPSAPANVAGNALSDREIDLSWAPSTTSSGASVSYLVMRNGKLLRNTRETSLRVGNLFPASSYSFSLIAVDSLGYRSPETPPLSIATLAPKSTKGEIYAFVLASTDRSFQALQQRYAQLGTVIPTYYDCDGASAFPGRNDPLITGWAKLRGLKVTPRWNCQRTAILTKILRDPTLRQATIDGIVQTSIDNGYDGVNIDFEAGAAADRSVYTSFVHDLAARLHAAGKTLSLDVSAKFKDVPNHPRSTFFDYVALSQSADAIFVMAWGVHWATSGPGSIDDLPWFTKVADYVAAQPLRDRFVMGLAMYGTDWASGGGAAHPGKPLEYEDVMALASSVGATPTFDATAGTPRFSYSDSNGVPHDVWYANAASMELRVELARARGLRVGVWRLGREDPAIWNLAGLQPPG